MSVELFARDSIFNQNLAVIRKKSVLRPNL
jgi:hypothetical protein